MQLAGSRAGKACSAADISGFHRLGDSTRMTIRGFTGPQTASLVAVPTPRQGVRPAWLTQLIDTRMPLGVATYVDALTGATLVRESLVDFAADNPTWDVFPASPPDRLLLHGYAGDVVLVGRADLRPGGGEPLVAGALGRASPEHGVTNTSIGNNAEAYENWNSNDPFTAAHRAGDLAAGPS